MRLSSRLRGVVALAVLAASLSVVTTDFADARRGGSFGSRGARSYNAPAATTTAPTAPGGLERSMTPRQTAQPGAAARAPNAAQQNRGGMFGGLAGGLLGGLALGGLIGMMMGNGIGGLAGMFGLLLQIGIAAAVVMLALRFFRGRRSSQPAYAGAGNSPYSAADSGFGQGSTAGYANASRPSPSATPYQAAGNLDAGVGVPASGGLGGTGSGTGYADAGDATQSSAATGSGDELGLGAQDYDAFEQLLVEVQAAFSREDYSALRSRCTPEIVSFLSEELSENAVKGLKNDVTDVKLLQGDLSEAWREGGDEYATVAMRYESVDVMRDRATGEVREGSNRPTDTAEIWTFARPSGGAWKLSAIQEV